LIQIDIKDWMSGVPIALGSEERIHMGVACFYSEGGVTRCSGGRVHVTTPIFEFPGPGVVRGKRTELEWGAADH